MNADLSNWMNEPQAAAALGISTRSLRRMVERKQISSSHRQRPGAKPERVFDPEVIRQRQRPAEPTAIMRTNGTALSQSSELPVEWRPPIDGGMIPAAIPIGADQLAVIANLVAEMVIPREPAPPWKKLREAAKATGLSKRFLRRLIDKAKLEAVRDGAIKVHQDALDNLDVSTELVRPVRPKKAKGKK